MSLIQSSERSLVSFSYEYGPSYLDSEVSSSSTPRRLPSLSSSQLALANFPTPAEPPSTPSVKIHSIIVAVVWSEPAGYLHGVEGDLAFVFAELGARTTDFIRVITDVEGWNDRPQVRPPSLYSVKSSIEEVGQVLEPGDLCYLYIGAHIEMNPDGTSFMPLPNGERLDGNVLASWIQTAAAGGGSIIAFVDVCHSSAFLRMATIYDIDTNGTFFGTTTGAEEPHVSKGEVIILSSTQCGQLALTVDVQKGQHAGKHGFFTWVLFKYLRVLKQPQQTDAEKLLLALRTECANHPDKPLPQLSATHGNLQNLPIGTLSA